MKEILFLVHRLPFPPNKGDKIRSFNILRQLSENYKVHLGCFVDDPDDFQFVPELESLCQSVCIRPLPPLWAKIKSLRGFLLNQALSIPYYYDRRLERWVKDVLSSADIDAVLGYSSPMAQYIPTNVPSDARTVIDLVDIDSDKWAQYAERARWPMGWIYRREARLLLDYERRVALDFDATVFVSDGEVQAFLERASGLETKVHAVRNGVATDYFDPSLEFENPFRPEKRPIVFTGMMNYWPNEDATQWFASDVLPKVLDQYGDAEFWIVGAAPTPAVERLAHRPGVHVTGRVPDVRPYLQYASVVVAPLRIARGVQNKVLEALAMGRNVICSPEAAFGLHPVSSSPYDVADSAESFARHVCAHLGREGGAPTDAAARAYVNDHYDWQANLRYLERLLVPASNQDER